MAGWARGATFVGIIGLVTTIVGGLMMWQTAYDAPGGAGNVVTGLFVLSVGVVTLLLVIGWTGAVLRTGAEIGLTTSPGGPVLEKADTRLERPQIEMNRPNRDSDEAAA